MTDTEKALRNMLADLHTRHQMHEDCAIRLQNAIGQPCTCFDGEAEEGEELKCSCQSDEDNRADAATSAQLAHAAALMANSIALLITRNAQPDA